MELIRKHLLTILCAVCILLLLLPIANVTTVMKTEIFGQTSESKATVAISGFSALGTNIFAYLLLLGPVLLVAMNYIKQLDKYKSLLSVIVPVVCLIALIIVLLQCGSVSAKASNSAAKAEVTVSWAIGAYLLILAYIGTAIAGGVVYHGLRLDKEGLQQLKNGAADLVSSAQEKLSDIKIGGNSNGVSISNDGANAPAGSHEPVKKSANQRRADEVLALLERLAEMKDRGILSEEEFNKKKAQLLEEI